MVVVSTQQINCNSSSNTPINLKKQKVGDSSIPVNWTTKVNLAAAAITTVKCISQINREITTLQRSTHKSGLQKLHHNGQISHSQKTNSCSITKLKSITQINRTVYIEHHNGLINHTQKPYCCTVAHHSGQINNTNKLYSCSITTVKSA